VTSNRTAPVLVRPLAGLRVRTPQPDDVPALLDFLTDGLQGYRSFAPPGWVPPVQNTAAKVQRTLAELAGARTHSRMAVDGSEVVGFVHLCGPDSPVDVRLRYLFVAEPWWGTGLAQELHDGAVAALGDRRARLFTPDAHARARRFYERRGWRRHGDPQGSPLGLPVVEYRRTGGAPT